MNIPSVIFLKNTVRTIADTNSDSSYNTLSYHKCSKRAVKLLFTSTYTDPVKVALLYNKSGLNIQNNNINDKDIKR